MPFIVKVIRLDEKDFWDGFILGITPSAKLRAKTELRKGQKRRFTVRSEGVVERVHKPSQYPEDVKKDFSQIQSVSYIPDHYHPPVFGHKKARSDRLLGIRINLQDALPNRIFLYDTGTVNRPYDKDTELEAHQYYYRKVDPKKKLLFKNYGELDQALQDKKIRKHYQYNEVLARIRWNLDGTSQICIFSDNLETRLFAQDRAKSLLKRLEQQSLEQGKHWDKSYTIPISFYLPGEKNNLMPYSEQAQKKDRAEAKAIFADPQKRKQMLENGSYEILLAVKDEPNLWDITDKENINILLRSLAEGRLNIFSSVVKASGVTDLHSLFKHADNNLLNSALRTCAKANKLDYVKALINSGANFTNYNPNDPDHPGLTAMHIAAKYGSMEVMSYFLNQIGNINLIDNFIDKAPLLIAAAEGQTEMVKFLLTKGSNINQKSQKNGFTALHLAAYFNQFDTADLLIQKGADVNAVINTINCTPLFYAASIKHDDPNISNLLLEKGANPLIPNNVGELPIHAAAGAGNTEILKTLLRHKSAAEFINAKTVQGLTPLQIAVQNADIKSVKLLLEHGADLAHATTATPAKQNKKISNLLACKKEFDFGLRLLNAEKKPSIFNSSYQEHFKKAHELDPKFFKTLVDKQADHVQNIIDSLKLDEKETLLFHKKMKKM